MAEAEQHRAELEANWKAYPSVGQVWRETGPAMGVGCSMLYSIPVRAMRSFCWSCSACSLPRSSVSHRVYPKERALALAAANKIPVLAVPSDVPPSLTAPVVAITPEQQEVPATQVLEGRTAPTQPEILAAAQPPNELPQTASPLPLVALIGLVGAGVGLILQLRSIRSQPYHPRGLRKSGNVRGHTVSFPPGSPG